MIENILVEQPVYFRHLRDEFWSAVDMNTGKTWWNFTQERGFTVEDIEAGRSWAQRLNKKIAEGVFKPAPWQYGYVFNG